MWVPFETVNLGGLPIAIASRDDLVNAMVADCIARRDIDAKRRARLVFDANGQGISMRDVDAPYRQAVDQADIVHADGGFLISISRMKGHAIPERSATTDMIHDFALRAESEGLSFYLLGGKEQVNSGCAIALKSRYPQLNLVGRRNGYFSQDEEQAMIDEINGVAPDILWVGLGKPKEQVFSLKWRDKIDAGWIVTCGGCFNFVAGHYRRAPDWMQRLHLEWVHRMITNPRKLFWRYLTTTPHALWLVLFRSRHG